MTTATATRKTSVPSLSPVDLELSLRKRLNTSFDRLCWSLCTNPDTVFDHFLEFIVNGFLVNGKGLPWWKYTPEQAARFREVFAVWVECSKEILQTRDWYDFLGYLYENAVAGIRRKQGNGQFFTPIHVVDLMAAITSIDKKPGEILSDPCCGSGRMLLAGHATNPEIIVHGNDLDRTCCLMTVCNLLIHGCRGRVTWGNALVPNDIRQGWLVNPMLGQADSPLGDIPHIVLEEKQN